MTIRCSTSETINLLLPWNLEKLRAMPLIGTSQTFWLGILKSITSWTLAIVKTNDDTQICVNNEEIKTVDKLELLGVILDSNFNFTDHISLFCKKASPRTGALMWLRNLIPTSAKLLLFKTAILPYLTYCQLVWHFCRASDLCKIERLQERGLRAVYKDHYATYSELLQRAQLPTLKKDACKMYVPLCIKSNTNYVQPILGISLILIALLIYIFVRTSLSIPELFLAHKLVKRFLFGRNSRVIHRMWFT